MLIGRYENVQSEYEAVIHCTGISWAQNTLDHAVCPSSISVFPSPISFLHKPWIKYVIIYVPESCWNFTLRHSKQEIRLNDLLTDTQILSIKNISTLYF